MENLTPMSILFDRKENRTFLFLALAASIIIFIVFKYFYPYPNFIHGDSFVYISMAYSNPKIGTYPIGYPMFLRLFSVFSTSDTALVAFQYFFLQAGIVFFLLTVFDLCGSLKITKIIAFLFFLLTPVNIYLANYISSDSIFCALSLIWFAQIITVIYRPTRLLIISNAIILVLLFMIRYNALFYPLITLTALFIGNEARRLKLIGMLLSLVLIGLFIRYTQNDYLRLSGHRQFSPFSGWQLANNALYSYRYVDSSKRKTLPVRFHKLDKMVRNYFDSTRDVKKYPWETLEASTVYMWDARSPLSLYADDLIRDDSVKGKLRRWAKAAPIMKEYGTELIKTYPSEFINHYLLPNSMKYYAPPVEFLEVYNNGVDSVNDIASTWFNYKSNKIFTRASEGAAGWLSYYSVAVGTMNVLLLANVISFLILKFYKRFEYINKLLILIFILWMTNFTFSVFASPIALRFQMFAIFVYSALVFVLMERLILIAFERDVCAKINYKDNGWHSVFGEQK